MYAFVLVLHSWLRWLVLGVGIAHGVRSFIDWRQGAEWSVGRDKLRVSAVGLMDLQVLLGLLLYFALSPISQSALSNMGAAMKDPALRFYGVEHIATMLLATVVMHVGQVRARRKDTPARHKTLFITQAVWLVLVLASIPWPGLDIGRPLFRF
jgi:hypothetical protein